MKVCPRCGYRELTENQEACIKALRDRDHGWIADYCRQRWTSGYGDAYIDSRVGGKDIDRLRAWVSGCNREALQPAGESEEA